MRPDRTIPLALAVALAAPATADAHVTVQPSTVPAGGFTRLNVRAPNERDDKGTIKVEVERAVRAATWNL